jgi:hypothetical protein
MRVFDGLCFFIEGECGYFFEQDMYTALWEKLAMSALKNRVTEYIQLHLESYDADRPSWEGKIEEEPSAVKLISTAHLVDGAWNRVKSHRPLQKPNLGSLSAQEYPYLLPLNGNLVVDLRNGNVHSREAHHFFMQELNVAYDGDLHRLTSAAVN